LKKAKWIQTSFSSRRNGKFKKIKKELPFIITLKPVKVSGKNQIVLKLRKKNKTQLIGKSTPQKMVNFDIL